MLLASDVSVNSGGGSKRTRKRKILKARVIEVEVETETVRCFGCKNHIPKGLKAMKMVDSRGEIIHWFHGINCFDMYHR